MSKLMSIAIVFILTLGMDSALSAQLRGNRATTEMLSTDGVSTLTVEVTVQSVKDGRFPREVMNKGARAELVKMLKDKNQSEHLSNVILGLGEIGEPNDVDQIVAVLTSLHGKLDQKTKDVPTKSIEAITNMSSRNFKSAREELKKMVDPEYWDKFDFVASKSIPEYYVNQSTYLAYYAMSVSSWGRDPNYTDNIEKAVKKVRNEKSRKLLESRIPACVKNYNMHQKAIQSGDPERFYRENVFKKKEIPQGANPGTTGTLNRTKP